jgi:CBS domain-containing protein
MDWRQIRAGDLMSTPAIALRENVSIRRARLEMELQRIRHIPVIDREGHVRGIVTDRDLGRALAGARPGTRLKLGDCMHRRVLAVSADSPAYQAVELMLRARIGCLPVIGCDDRLVGIVTDTDVVRLCYDALVGHEPRLTGNA